MMFGDVSGMEMFSSLVGMFSLAGMAIISLRTINILAFVLIMSFLLLICYEGVFITVKKEIGVDEE